MTQNINGSFPKNAMYGHAYVMNQNLVKTFSPADGLYHGTIFPELVSPYSPGDSMKEIMYLKNYDKGGVRE